MIEIFGINQSQEVDRFIESHPKGHFMQTSYWGRVKTEWEWIGVLCKDDSGKAKGAMGLLYRPLSIGISGLLYAPRGPVCDRDDLQTFEELINAAKAIGKKRGAYTLRLDPEIPEDDVEFADYCRGLGFQIDQASDYSLFQPRLVYQLSLKDKTPETLLASYHRSTRYNVNLAVRRGVTIRRGTVDELPIFSALMEETAAKNEFHPRSKAYFELLMKGMGDYARLYFASLNDKLVAGAIVVYYGKKANLMYSCSTPDSFKDRPNELLQWTIQSDMIELGCDLYDFRGVEGYPEEDNPKIGLHKYKQGYDSQFLAFVGQLDYVLRPMVAKLYKFLTQRKK
jgi:lipid II:glycine glycyltransferase (peptidoglycan interpeptide bridge formation enzyme)